MSWNEPSVYVKFDFELQSFRIAQNFNSSSIPSILLGHQVAKAYALTMPKWNCMKKMRTDAASTEIYDMCNTIALNL